MFFQILLNLKLIFTNIMEVFPGATIDAITPTTNPETEPQNADDTASVDEEEMSG